MAESARRHLQRELAELLSFGRSAWSPRAVIRAARMLRGIAGDRDARRDRLVEQLGIDPDGTCIWHSSDEIRTLESRAWLLSVGEPGLVGVE
jgi:hypothetical protein